jgi:glycosyltransferase involved in cell wall biosynthesis
LEQTYTNLEIWIIDDASSDETLKKIRAFKDGRIKIVACKQNTQKIGAVNEVLQKVKGDLITFQDADDWSEPKRIERQVEQFSIQPLLGICFTKYARYSDHKKTLPGRIALSNEELRDEFLQFGHRQNSGFGPTACPTMMITKNVLQKTGGYHPYFTGRVAEDIQWIYRILNEHKGITVDDELYNYTFQINSFTHKQVTGEHAKYAYSWQLLAKIIYKDIHENIDVLAPGNETLLKSLELEACEEALVENIKSRILIQRTYEASSSFRLGKFLLSPLRFFKK